MDICRDSCYRRNERNEKGWGNKEMSVNRACYAILNNNATHSGMRCYAMQGYLGNLHISMFACRREDSLFMAPYNNQGLLI